MRHLILSAFLLFITLGTAAAQTPLYPARYTVAGLPAAATMTNRVVDVTDALAPGDCTVGGGTYRTPCISSGANWIPWGALGSGTGTVTSVGGTSPINSTGGATPVISIDNAAADGSTKGAATFSASDFSSSSGLIILDYVNAQKASASLHGFLTSTDWSTFNGKESALTFSTGLTRTVNTITVNTSQNIAKLSNLTTNGFVKTSGSDGTLSVDTNTYALGSRNIAAGVGLTGGGDLSADRTISMGTPSTLTVSSTNSASGTTHSHAITSSSNPGAAASLLATNGSGNLQLVSLTATTGGVSSTGGFRDSGTVISRFENTFASLPAGTVGKAVEIGVSSGTDGLVQAYDRTGAALIPLNLSGSRFNFQTGSVGIGIASPAAKLHVKGGNTNDLIIDNDGSQYTELDFANNGTNMFAAYWDNTNGFFTLGSVLNVKSGNVGIGTTNPAGKLHVHDGTNRNLRIMSDAGQFGTTGIFVQSLNDAASVALPLIFSATTFAVMSGNVGFGTVNPQTNLDVVGSIFVGDSNGANAKQLQLTYDTANNRSQIQSIYQGIAYTNLLLNPSGGNVGIGTVSPSYKLDVNGTGRFANDATFATNANPLTNYTSNLGMLSNKYLTLHAAELWVETLVAQNTMATIGGRVLVAPTTPLSADLAAAGTTITTKYNNLNNGDRVYMEANGKVEFMAVTSTAGGTSGAYTYTVTRNLDGSGANDWFAGDAVLNTGQTDNGYIDLYSVSGVLPASTAGPTIVGNVRTGSAYNAIDSRWAIGKLTGLYGYTSTSCSGTHCFGAAFGVNTGAWVKIDSTNGVRLGYNATTNVQIDGAGNASFAGAITANSGTIAGWTIASTALNSGTTYIASGADPVAGNVAWFGKSATLGSGVYFRDTGGTSIGMFVNQSGILPYLSAGDGTYVRVVLGGMNYSGFPGGSSTGMGLKIGDSSGNLLVEFSNTRNTIASLTIESNKMYVGVGTYANTNTSFYVDNSGAFSLKDKLQWNGSALTIVGNITATTGTIGGWTLGVTSLSAGSGSTTVAMDSGGTNPAFYAGSATPASAPFRVTNAGALTATNATITGNITATGGSITGTLTMSGASSAIAIGTTPPTSQSSGTGVWIDRTGIYSLTANSVLAGLASTGLYVQETTTTQGRINFQDSSGASTSQIAVVKNSDNSAAVGSNLSIWLQNTSTHSNISIGSETGTFDGLILNSTTALTATPNAMLDVRGSAVITGNVGIGTTSPQEKVQILKNGTASEGNFGLSILSAVSDTELVFGASASGDYSFIQSFQDGTSYSNRPLILMPNGGFVGIGTLSPSKLFEIANGVFVMSGSASFGSALTVTAQIYRSSADGLVMAGAGSTTDILITNKNGSTVMEVPTGTQTAAFAGHTKIGTGVNSASERLMINMPSGNSTGIQFYQDAVESWTIRSPASSTDLRFAASGADRVTIATGGNVGIGTTSPSRRLVISNGGAEGVEIGPGNANGDASGEVTWLTYNRASSAYVNNRFYAAGHFFTTGGIVVGSPTGGNKGDGTVNAVAVYDDNVLLTDWVFKGGVPESQDLLAPYKRLFSLDETRRMIDTEHRLPWMPNAAEFEKERKVGGMITRLYQGQEQQQKYVLELEDRIKKLEEQLKLKEKK